MATSKDSGAKKATASKAKQDNTDEPQPVDESADQPSIQDQADRVLSGEATTVNTTGAAPGQSPTGEMEPRERSGPVNAQPEPDADRK